MIQIPPPTQQIDFYNQLKTLQNKHLLPALQQSISKVEISQLDHELALYASKTSLNHLAQHGLRGELAYAVPCILEQMPSLLAYYRLLLGFSQKEFYTRNFGLTVFKSMESKGILTERVRSQLGNLCHALAGSSNHLIAALSQHSLQAQTFQDLALLTLGPQLRGGANVKVGVSGIKDVFEIIQRIVQHASPQISSQEIVLMNAAHRRVIIKCAADPDLVIKEETKNNKIRPIIAIEVKGGRDFSNIHNRIGEAEKSHQKAKADGFLECWTIVNVDRIDLEMSQKESPTTHRFFRLSALKDFTSEEYQDFQDQILSLTGIKSE